MGLFKKRTTDPSEIERLKSEMAAMSARLDAADSHKAQLGAQVHGLASRLDTSTASPASVATPVVAFEPAELDKLRALIQRVSDRVTELDGRVTSISTELANQLNEISADIDERPASADVEPSDAGFIDVLRGAQVRLANEQARFQIAFRHDLAELADRFTRQHPAPTDDDHVVGPVDPVGDALHPSDAWSLHPGSDPMAPTPDASTDEDDHDDVTDVRADDDPAEGPDTDIASDEPATLEAFPAPQPGADDSGGDSFPAPDAPR